jgi:hypothetical protein
MGFYETYMEIIKVHRSEELFISGGEPLLDDHIGDFFFLAQAAEVVQKIHIFTSYQFSLRSMAEILTIPMPDSVILNHIPIYFEPERWHN